MSDLDRARQQARVQHGAWLPRPTLAPRARWPWFLAGLALGALVAVVICWREWIP